MLTFILPALSAILAAFIEWLRIANKRGKVPNVSKFISVNIAVILFIVCLALSVDYYSEVTPGDVLVYGLYYIGCRGLFYDVCLNAFRGLRFDYFSDHTNSLIDNLSRNFGGFWALRLLSVLFVVIFGYLWQLLISNMI
jgi:hypothetical protein